MTLLNSADRVYQGSTEADAAYLGSTEIWRNVQPLFDNFDRPNSTNLGVTSTGGVPWEQWVGAWDINSNRIRNTSGTNPVAVVNAKTADVDIRLNVSGSGRDAVIFRASNATNWLRFSVYWDYSSGQTCTNVFTHQMACACWDACQQTEFGRWVSGCGSCPGCGSGLCGGGCYPTSGICSSTGSVCNQNCTPWTSSVYRVYLHKMVNGSLQQINFWNASSQTQLRVRAVGSQIQLWRNTTSVATVTDTFNQTATYHGVGRSQLGNQSGTALDNFDLVPV